MSSYHFETSFTLLDFCQDKVLVDVDIRKPSLYRIIYRFVNRSGRSVTAEVTATPDSSSETQQSKPVTFPPSRHPQFVTVSGGGITSAFVLNAGSWSISLKASETIFVVGRIAKVILFVEVYTIICFLTF